MLYAEEDPSKRALFFKCKICDYEERAIDGDEFENCVYKVDMEAKAMALIINPDIVDDPTLQKRNIPQCLNQNKVCSNKEVVTFYHITQDRFDLIYVCTKCRHAWRQTGKDKDYDIGSDSEEDPTIGKI